MHRRQFIKRLAASTLLFASPSILLGCRSEALPLFASAVSDNSGKHFIVTFNTAGDVKSKVQIANRGHDLAVLDEHRVVAFSRRPFTNLFIINITNNQLERIVEAEHGFHFYGHGVMDAKRRWLITSENHVDTARGFLVVRDSSSFEVIMRIPSGGIGPHQCALMPDGDHIVVANGGIRTHPQTGRKKLNLATMESNLSYLNLDSQSIIQQVSPPHFQLSLRHLAVAKTGEVIVGAQYQGHYRDIHPLVFSHRHQNSLTPLSGKQDFWQAFDHYTASIAISDNTIAVTSPRGNIVSYWRLDTQKIVTQHRLSDCAGVAAHQKHFMVTNGKGQAIESNYNENPLFKLNAHKFDNHLIAI